MVVVPMISKGSNLRNLPAEARELSVVVPTYKEVLNIPRLVARLAALRPYFEKFEVIVVDDNSQDGTEKEILAQDASWVRLIVRTSDRGLSPSVIEGLRAARYSTLVVMDADLSHPPESIPEMIERLFSRGTDFVVGSRYIEGGSIDQSWSLLRSINSWGATILARPFANIKDPMSGFFALRRKTFENAEHLNPIGYKIGLELIVKCRCVRVEEVPIHFADRTLGESKLSLREQLKYLRHIKRLADYKFGNASYFVQFGIVGAMGVLVQMVSLTLLLTLGLKIEWAVAGAIVFAMTSNFSLNRLVTFSSKNKANLIRQYIKFVGACSVGAIVNYGVTMGLIRSIPDLQRLPQLPALAGVLAGMAFNFFLSRYVVFKHQAQSH